ncbi:DUF2141 domain-containing protein [Sphingomonas sp. Mn802worker]|uniref:DUF2141 domain-containing protein n=1 Tax=Sphingomonas sp. Mn802worker TaxID=629773 RepID=UPI0006867EB3|nr:DUF2141 domain-containing protein [Sphingomonas sp. Mn802worker]
MQRRGNARIAALTGATLLLIGAAPVASLDVGIEHVRSVKGLLRVCLTADPENFPSCVDDKDAVTRNVPAATHGLRFTGLPHGTYAVAVIHDENSNAKLDTFAGIPREGFGFSRNPPIRFGAPRFAAARFAVESDAERQQIGMRYIL